VSDLIFPHIQQRVRLRDSEATFDEIVAVIDTDGEGVTVDAVVDSAEAHLLFSSSSGAVHLTGPLVAAAQGSRLRIVEVDSFQRRGSFRIGMGVWATVARIDERPLCCSVRDLSLTGALLGPEAFALEPDEHVVLNIHVDGLERLELAGVVVRRDGNMRGLSFDTLSRRDDAALQRVIAAAQRPRT